MNDGEKLFLALGQVEDRYLERIASEALERPKEGPNIKKRSPGRVIRVLLVAATISALVITASASEIGSWFVQLFSGGGETPLTDSQITMIEEKEQIIQEVQTDNGWTVELRSVMSDGALGYIILGVTAPEDVSLEDVCDEDGTITSGVWPGTEKFRTRDILTGPKGVLSSGSYYWEDDGDGKANTRNYVIQLEPQIVRKDLDIDPLGPDVQWNIHIEGFHRDSENTEYLEELLNGKYKGQTDYMLESEEAENARIIDVLTEGVWDFSFTFDDGKNRMELLSQPIVVKSDAWIKTGPNMADTEMAIESITVTSIVLTPFTATITHENAAPYFTIDGKETYAVMKDGTNILLRHSSGDSNASVLIAESPLVFQDLDHLLFPDGTKVPVPQQ